MKLDPPDFFSTLYDTSSLQEVMEALVIHGGQQTLLTFITKAQQFLLQEETVRQSSYALTRASRTLLQGMIGCLPQISDRALCIDELFSFLKTMHFYIEPLLTTKQEKRIAADLVSLLQEERGNKQPPPSLDETKALFQHIERVLALLERILEQKENSIIPRSERSDKQVEKKSFGAIDEEKAVQVILELEREEREVEQKAR